MNTDPIADLLTRIRNATNAGHLSTVVPASTTKGRILQVLTDEGYINKFEQRDDAAGKPEFKVTLRYLGDGRPAIKMLSRLSKPGRRVYVPKDEVKRYRGGLGLTIVSTSQGMMSDAEARKRGIGGELICSVF